MATPAPAIPKPRPYTRFLTSALHTRFVHAALVSLLLSWDNAILTGVSRSLLWAWFPLGPAGARAVLFFITNLCIFILQIATLNVGRPTSTSPLSRLRSLVFSLTTFWTFFWYLFSALWFSETYIWYSSSLSWVTKGDVTKQDTLNERPIYLRTFFFVLAIAHAVRHLYYSHSTLQIPILPAATPRANDSRTHPIDDRYTLMKKQVPSVLLRSAVGSVILSILAPFIYTIFLRQWMWKAHLFWAKLFFNLRRSNARATGLPPIFGTMPTTIMTGFLLSFTWEACSLLFITYLGREPIKKDKPLSAASKDPNGTLLNGLKAKRDTVKTFALWELAIIAQSNAERRKAIFIDIERPTGPMWPQMLAECLKVLKQLDDRISPPKDIPLTLEEKAKPIETLPKIIPAIRSEQILAPPTPTQSIGREFGDLALKVVKNLGTSPEPWRPQLDKAVKLIEDSKIADARSQIATDIKQSPIAWLFKSTNAAKINAIVLGAPFGNAAILVDAIEAVTRMLIASLQEDLYGNAMKGVPATVKQFTTSITLIETFIKANPPGNGDINEVEIVLGRLKAGLRELLSAFQTFLNDTALGIGELNAAKRASGQQIPEEARRKAPMQLRDVDPQPRAIENDARRGDTWRSLGRQPGEQQRLQGTEAPARLFTRQEQPRKTSREMNGNARMVHVSRREMEQVR